MLRLTFIAIASGSLLGAPLFAQEDRHAVPRGGGGGGGSSHVGARHTGPTHSPAPSGHSPSSSAAAPNLTDAQRRHPRAGTGTGGGHGRRGGYPGGGWYYAPGYWSGWYSPYYSGYWWPYGAYGWAGYWGGGPWGAGAAYHYVQSDRGSIRVLVDPPDARVYVDGYYAGVVDDFDGLFQRLHVAPGRHEIEVKLAGHKTYRVRVYVSSGSTLKLDHELIEGAGETFEDLAGEIPDSEVRYERPAPYPDDHARGAGPEPDGGELLLRVDPADASVYVDGVFRGTGQDSAVLSLAPGRHQIEVVRPGYRTEEREVEVRPSDVTEVTIELGRP